MNKLFNLTLLFVFLCFSCYSQIKTKPSPNWIKKQEYNIDPQIDQNEITQGTLILLYDEQVNVPEQEAYYRLVTKITDNVGIQNASSINVAFDPTYQSLMFHEITIKRGEQTIDKLEISNFQLNRRELNAENYIYDGTLSAMMNLSDVRTNDIIDYSYSVIGFNPIHNGVFSSSFYLNNSEPVGKITINIVTNKELNYKLINGSLQPIIEKRNGLFNYAWENTNTKRLEFENNTPIWKLLYKNVFVSEYDSWEDVVNWGIKVFEINEKLDKELNAKIEEISSFYKTDGGKIEATLNFVQDEIRYLGLESGIGSYKPFSPNRVFKMRYGDCKDKSLLMVTMLNKMGVNAYPMLVNTSLEHMITELTPSPKFFDHCVVKVVDGAENEFWYDPTISNQGGTFKTTYFPNYQYGLVLKKGNKEFDEIFSFANNEVEILDEFILEEVGKGATLKVTSVFHENEADMMRSYFKNNSISSIKKDYQNYYANYYNNISTEQNPEYKDNIKENKFTVYESYKLDSIWQPLLENSNNISVSFFPSSIMDILLMPIEKERKTEFMLSYPSSKRHKIKVKLPQKWAVKNENSNINSTGFYYESDIAYNRNLSLLTINHFIKIQKSYLTVDEFGEYSKDVKNLNNNIGYYIYIPNGNKDNNVNSFGGLLLLVKYLFVIGILIFIGVKLLKKIRKH